MSLGYPLARGPGSKEIRQHHDFPQFAEDTDLVKIWQKHGWPDMVEPILGTDSSDMQFTVTGRFHSIGRARANVRFHRQF